MLLLAPPDKCGEACDVAEGVFNKAAEKSSDIFRFGVLDVFESIPGDEGTDVVVAQHFNITAVPALLMFQVGHKSVKSALKVEAQSAMAIMSSAKRFYQQFATFVPSLSQRVTQHSLKRFLTEVGTGMCVRACGCGCRCGR